MILTGNAIYDRIMGQHEADGTRISIEPFNPQNVNPNSYNLTLDNKLQIYTNPLLDPRTLNQTTSIEIPPEGIILKPGLLYLGSTVEHTETEGLVPSLEGRSSIARLGLFVHVTAGFGDNGFKGRWTLELVATQPIRIYPNMKICQIVYHTVSGVETFYDGKYQNSKGVVASKMNEDM